MARSPRNPLLLTVALVAVTLLLAACSAEVSFGGGDANDTAIDSIEADLTEQIGLGPLDIECESIEDPDVGDTFTCTGTTEDGQVIDFAAEVTGDESGEPDGVSVRTTNVLVPDDLPGLAQEAAGVLSEQTGVALGPNDLVCPQESVVVEVDATVECELTDPTDGAVYVATITFNDPENLGFVIEVGEQIG